jgi:hypothetical protein
MINSVGKTKTFLLLKLVVHKVTTGHLWVKKVTASSGNLRLIHEITIVV